MNSLKVCIVCICSIFILLNFVKASPIPEEEIKDSVHQAKGILDGLPTAAPGGLGGLGQTGGNASPKLIVGAFQAVVTNFDPSLITGLPGLGGGLMPAG